MSKKNTVLITGSAGLIGSEAARHFHERGYKVVGIDNDLRQTFLGSDASSKWNLARLKADLGNYRHADIDIRDQAAVEELFASLRSDLALVVHAAAQSSHDWAVRDPHSDFAVNANGTLVLLEAMRKFTPDAVFIFTSTNKVYGDAPNRLPLIELDSRWELDRKHKYVAYGIDENLAVDRSTHSPAGASKLAADLMVQEYGRYHGLRTTVFRIGCVSGSALSGTAEQGFLSYLMKCAATGAPYTVFGYQGKQVRDTIHVSDLSAAFWEVLQAPRTGAVYNMGGSRTANCSVLEAIELSEMISGQPLNWTYSNENRRGDHVWWISDTRRFEKHYPDWARQCSIGAILTEIHDVNKPKWELAS